MRPTVPPDASLSGSNPGSVPPQRRPWHRPVLNAAHIRDAEAKGSGVDDCGGCGSMEAS
jgi:hypothetical protein